MLVVVVCICTPVMGRGGGKSYTNGKAARGGGE